MRNCRPFRENRIMAKRSSEILTRTEHLMHDDGTTRTPEEIAQRERMGLSDDDRAPENVCQ